MARKQPEAIKPSVDSSSDRFAADRDLNEAAELEAQSILESAQQDAIQLEHTARRLGVSRSDIDFAPGNAALQLADATRAQGQKQAVLHLFEKSAVLCWRRLAPDVEKFMVELDLLWEKACSRFRATATLSNESKRNWRIWALHQRAASASSQHEQPRTDTTQETRAKAETERRGYRAEVQAWMESNEIETVPEAAGRLAVGVDTLKSIMSSKGDKRYSDETLLRILKAIGHKAP